MTVCVLQWLTREKLAEDYSTGLKQRDLAKIYGVSLTAVQHAFKRLNVEPRLPIRDPLERFWAKVEKTDYCWLWQGAINSDHGSAYYHADGRFQRAARWIWKQSHGPIRRGLEVCHTCDNPACVRPSHLFLGTHLQNMQDMSRKGRASKIGMKGEAHPQCKLSDDDVRRMKKLRMEGASIKELMDIFGVEKSYVPKVMSGHLRKGIEP
jgi:hypothetical protein